MNINVLLIAFTLFLASERVGADETGEVSREAVAAEIRVEATPHPGESRASDNFELAIPKGCTELYWTIEDPPNEGISFSVVEGAPFVDDVVLLQNVTDKSTSHIVKAKGEGGLFIGIVKHAQKAFKVKVFARVVSENGGK